MKAIKIILGIIIALSVVFFATGLAVKEIKYTAEVTINKPVNEVFALFEDSDKMKEWLPEVKSIEPIEERPGKVGSTYTMTVENQGETVVMEEKIMAYILNEKLTFQFDSDDMIKVDDYNFIAEGDKTKVVQNCTIEAKSYMMGCIFPWFKSMLKDISLDYMNRFKEIVEKT